MQKLQQILIQTTEMTPPVLQLKRIWLIKKLPSLHSEVYCTLSKNDRSCYQMPHARGWDVQEREWLTHRIHTHTQELPSWNKVTFLPLNQCPQLQTHVLQRELQVCRALVLGWMSGLSGVLVHNSHKCLTADLVLNCNSSAVRQAAWGYCQMKG